MSDNPYAAPQFPGDLPPTQGGMHGPPSGWDASEVIGIAWEIFKRHWAVLFGSAFLVYIVSQVPGWIAQGIQVGAELEQGSPEQSLVQAVGSLIGSLISLYFSVGQVRLYLQAARGQTPDFSVLFSGMDRFPAVLGMGFLAGILILLGLILLIIPGIILSYGLYMGAYFVIDHRMGPVEGLKKSWEVTNGHKANLFVFSLLGGLVVLAGCFACLVGAFAGQAVVGVATAIIFLRLTGEQTAAPAVWGAE
ncbi:MAG: hypothetical protein H6718_09170 [Polyangiaceae bacterium]|nr:hypothetical protein [Polyangiaceae bacterium]